jgi:CheY-like chemotaxis protein
MTKQDPVERFSGEFEQHTILVAEDEILIRMWATEVLRTAGYNVLEAANAEEAITILGHLDDLSVLVTDLRMPGAMDGLRLAQDVKQSSPHIKIILASATPLLDGERAIFDAVLWKPYSAIALLNAVKGLTQIRELPAGPGG